MKKGFALLETMIVITFLSISLMLLYSTFSNMLSNSKKNILYDDVSNIYQVYYLKEYLLLNNLSSLLNNSDIKEITCRDFAFDSCENFLNTLNINKIYLTKYDLKNIDNMSSTLANYLKSLSNKDNFSHRLVVEFQNEPNYSYASIGVSEE